VPTLENRPNTALVVIDVQNGVVEGTHNRDNVVAKRRPFRREGTAGTRADRLGPEKSYGDSFEDANLETVFADLDVGRLVGLGAQNDACIRSTEGRHGRDERTSTSPPPAEERL